MRRLPTANPGYFNGPITIDMAVAFLCCRHERLGAASVFHGLPEDAMVSIFCGIDQGFTKEGEYLHLSWEQTARKDSRQTPLKFQTIMAFTVTSNQNKFISAHSPNVFWLKHVFEHTHWPTPILPWQIILNFGVPMRSTNPSYHFTDRRYGMRNWNDTRLHQGCEAERCQCTRPFQNSARATRAFNSLNMTTMKLSKATLWQMQAFQDNYHQLFLHTRRFRGQWLAVRDVNSNFLVCEPTWGEMGVKNHACMQTFDRWVLQCLQQLWGARNCDLYVRVRTKAEGLQIFIFGRGLVPESVMHSHLFRQFRAKLNGSHYL